MKIKSVARVSTFAMIALVSVSLLACSSSKKDLVDRETMPLDSQEALVQKCYASAITQGQPGEPADEGTIDVSVGVSPQGRVAHASIINSTMNSKRLDDCVLTVVRDAKFDKDPSGRALNLTHTYKFRKK